MNKVLIKFVKKANMWCKTSWVDGKQKKKQVQEWSADKPKENDEESIDIFE